MPPREVERHFYAEPFVPFRMHLRDGETRDIVRPSTGIVTGARVEVGVEWDEDEDVYITSETIPTDDIEHLEPIDPNGGEAACGVAA